MLPSSSDKTLPAFRFAPKPVNVDHIRTKSCGRDFQKALTLSRSEKDALFLRQSVADIPVADSGPRRFSPAEPLDVIFGGFGLHAKLADL